MADIDPDFDEPQARPRSCTWPLRRPDFLKKPGQQQAPSSGEGTPAAVAEEIQDPALAVPQVESPDIKQDLAAVATNRKNCSRRNAWGNLSYADLITKAIQSAPEQRLTLSQIYDWMVKNVPFFKDKGDSNSSAGWKNSIRHNLSLHSRFVRVQNEGTGKSSWWMINPDAKPGKSSRRRASSMDTNNPKWEKKRGRAKKKVLEERAKWSTSPTPNKFEGGEPESTLSLALSSEFRSRASSNASSCGRLSPINQIDDMHDNEVPPMSPGPYDLGHHQTQPYESPDHLHTDQLTSLAQAMSLNTSLNGSVSSELNSPVEQLRVPTPMRPSPKHTSRGNLFQNTSNGNSYMTYSPAPSYSGSDISPVHSNVQSPAYSPYAQNAAMSPIPQQRCSPSMSITDMSQQFSISVPQQPSAFSLMPHQDPGMTTNGAILSKRDPMLSHSTLQPGSMMHQRPTNLQSTCRVQTNMSQGRSSLQGFSPQTSPSNPLPMLQLNPVITASQNNHMSSPTHISVNPQYSQSSMNQPLQSIPINQSSDKVPSDLQNLDVDMFKGMDCDIDSIINHELCMEDGNMDFNFDGPISQTVTSSPNWVH